MSCFSWNSVSLIKGFPFVLLCLKHCQGEMKIVGVRLSREKGTSGVLSEVYTLSNRFSCYLSLYILRQSVGDGHL